MRSCPPASTLGVDFLSTDKAIRYSLAPLKKSIAQAVESWWRSVPPRPHDLPISPAAAAHDPQQAAWRRCGRGGLDALGQPSLGMHFGSLLASPAAGSTRPIHQDLFAERPTAGRSSTAPGQGLNPMARCSASSGRGLLPLRPPLDAYARSCPVGIVSFAEIVRARNVGVVAGRVAASSSRCAAPLQKATSGLRSVLGSDRPVRGGDLLLTLAASRTLGSRHRVVCHRRGRARLRDSSVPGSLSIARRSRQRLQSVSDRARRRAIEAAEPAGELGGVLRSGGRALCLPCARRHGREVGCHARASTLPARRAPSPPAGFGVVIFSGSVPRARSGRVGDKENRHTPPPARAFGAYEGEGGAPSLKPRYMLQSDLQCRRKAACSAARGGVFAHARASLLAMATERARTLARP